MEWLEKADFECKLVVAGNHDLTLDAEFYEEFGKYFHNRNPQDPARCRELLAGSPSLTYLEHAGRAVRLASPTGPRTAFSVFGSPYTPRYGKWAFQYTAHDDFAADALWRDIPAGTDVVVTHGPAHLHRDESRGGAQGCEGLRRALWRVRPKLALCGHIHDARGAERVRWDLRNRHIRYKELAVEPWEDPAEGNDKNSLIDLTARGGNPIDNVDDAVSTLDLTLPPSRGKGTQPSTGEPGPTAEAEAEAKAEAETGVAKLGIGTRGLSGNPASARSDQAALAGRLGRRETCFVNCAIQSASYPHRGGGPRVLNKPIVVDLDLPVWDDSDPRSPPAV